MSVLLETYRRFGCVKISPSGQNGTAYRRLYLRLTADLLWRLIVSSVLFVKRVVVANRRRGQRMQAEFWLLIRNSARFVRLECGLFQHQPTILIKEIDHGNTCPRVMCLVSADVVVSTASVAERLGRLFRQQDCY